MGKQQSFSEKTWPRSLVLAFLGKDMRKKSFELLTELTDRRFVLQFGQLQCLSANTQWLLSLTLFVVKSFLSHFSEIFLQT